MDDRNNTIAGWVLGGGIAALGLTIASGMFFHAEVPEAGKQGYAIQGVETGEPGGTDAGPPMEVLMAGADISKGEAIFKKCVACHTIAAGGADGIGPNLHGVVGRPIASGAHAYSDALKGIGGTWSFEALNSWLSNPKKFAPGNKMTFAGLGNPEERAAVLVYLNSQGSNLPMPEIKATTPNPAAGEATAAPTTDAATATK
jgi:cytochrome c